jgi:phosphotransacetylase
MKVEVRRMQSLIDRAQAKGPIRLAVVGAGQGLVLDALLQAMSLGLIHPCLIGDGREIGDLAKQHGWDPRTTCITAVESDVEAAATAARLVREGRVDAIMKGHIHTDALMHVLLQEATGLRVPGRRASHVFMVDVPSYPKLLCITDAAVNIAPDLNAKAQILQNAVEVARAIGIEMPRAAVLSAVETINPAIVSTLDAAALTLMARRGQIAGVMVDGPLAFDNAISAEAAKEKGIVSEVAGNADIILVPDVVSGNILAKDLEYLAGATLAGIVVGLTAPVILTSRADPVVARLASIALAVLLHDAEISRPPARSIERQSAAHVAPQSETMCCPPSRRD